MKDTQLLSELQSRGVRLWREGERLGYEAPPGVLKPSVLAAMKASKRELLALLEAPAPAQAPPQVLAGMTAGARGEAASTCGWPPSEERLQLAREIGAVLKALPGAKRLRSGAWRFEGQVWEHDQAVLLAAHRRGMTSGGWALEADAGELYREHQAQVLEGGAQ